MSNERQRPLMPPPPRPRVDPGVTTYYPPTYTHPLPVAIVSGGPLAEGVCVWKPDQDGVFETSCGQAFAFTDGSPEENGARFCLYCGGSLREAVQDS